MLFWPASLDLLHELSSKKKKTLSPSSKEKDRHTQGRVLQALKSVPQNEGHSRSSAQRAAGPADWPRPMAALQGGRPFGKQQPWLWALLAFASKASSPPHCLRDGVGGSLAASPTLHGGWRAPRNGVV